MGFNDKYFTLAFCSARRTLELVFADGIDAKSLFGTTFKLFEWNGRLLDGHAFDHIITLPGLGWDTANLYSTGEITLIPEPGTFALILVGAISLLKRRK